MLDPHAYDIYHGYCLKKSVDIVFLILYFLHYKFHVFNVMMRKWCCAFPIVNMYFDSIRKPWDCISMSWYELCPSVLDTWDIELKDSMSSPNCIMLQHSIFKFSKYVSTLLSSMGLEKFFYEFILETSFVRSKYNLAFVSYYLVLDPNVTTMSFKF